MEPITDQMQQSNHLTPQPILAQEAMPFTKLNFLSNGIHALSIFIVSIFGLGIFLFLSYYSFRYTESNGTQLNAIMTDSLDSPLRNLCFVILNITLFSFFTWLLNKTGCKKEWIIKILLLIVMIYAGVISIWWVHSATRVPYADQAAIYGMSSYLIEGNFENLSPGGYLNLYPHQLGLIAIVELIFRIVGTYNYTFLEYLNAAMIPLALFAGYKATDVLFEHKDISYFYLFLCFGCFPLFIYSSWVYGEIPSVLFILLLTWMVGAYCKTGKTRFAVFATICSTFAIMVRENSVILVIAAFLVMVIYGIKKQKWQCFVVALCLIVAPVLVNFGIRQIYEARSGYEVDGGVPSIMWVAMGLQDDYWGPGWYNDYGVSTYYKYNMDKELASADAKEKIAERLAIYTADPAYGIDFFKRKMLTQWNDPFYQSLQLNSGCKETPTGFLWELYNGTAYKNLFTFVNCYQFLIYISCFSFVLFTRKSNYPIYVYLLLIGIIGGFLFTSMWESRSRYIFPYFIMMLPYAAAGMYQIRTKTMEFKNFLHKKIRLKH